MFKHMCEEEVSCSYREEKNKGIFLNTLPELKSNCNLKSINTKRVGRQEMAEFRLVMSGIFDQ